MDTAGSELHAAGSSAPISVITHKEDESEGNDCPKYEDLAHGSSTPDATISVITLKDDESQENDSSKCEDFTQGSELHPAGLSDPDAPNSAITFKEDESQRNDCPKYEDLTHDKKIEPPPPYMPPHLPSAPVEVSITIPTSLISEDAARQALLEYAKKKCCYSTGPAQQMLLQDFQPSNTFRYRLDTFTETRICKWVSDPYYDEEVDGPENGPPPDPWNLQAEPQNLFKNAEYYMALPHTSSVEICLQCSGLGRNLCMNCCGSGRSRCMYCGGSGWSSNQMCFSCTGTGRVWCMGCSGSGYQRCIDCSGKGRLLKYIQLTIKWENHNFEFIATHNSDFPTKRFKKVTGEMIFSDEQQMVSPVTNFPELSVKEASETVISEHRTKFTYCKILKQVSKILNRAPASHSYTNVSSHQLPQRHSIEWLPLTKVNYTWNGEEYDYFVYGKENRAYTTNYPRKCCCTIM